MNQEKNQFRLNTVKSKLMASLLVISIIPTSILGIVTQQNASDSILKKEKSNALEITEQVSTGIDKYAGGIGSQVSMLARVKSVAESVGNPKKESEVNDLLRNIKESRPDVISAYFASNDKKMNLYPQENLPEGYDPTSRDWYKVSLLNKGKVTLNEPYQDVSTKQFVVTVSETVEKDGKTIGVVAFDVSLQAIQNEINNATIGKSGYVFMTDTKGTLVAHPQNEKMGQSVSDETYWSKVKHQEKGSMTYVEKGKEYLLTFYTDKKTGWKFISRVPMEEVNKDINALNTLIWSIVAGFTVLAGLLAYIISRRISLNINAIQETMKKASKGDLTVRAQVKSKDELNDLAQSFNDMLDSVGKTLKDATQLSEQILDSSKHLSGMTNETTNSVLQVSEAIGQISEGAVISSENIQKGVQNMHELSDKLGMISESSQEMSQVSQHSAGRTKDGLQQVHILTEKSESAKVSSSQAAEIVKQMDKNVESIHLIMQTILSIADQTNLLSLNASIEAARAGEHGKGFAVVASEIRNLADQSKKSASEIQDIIARIIKNSNQAVTAIEKNDDILSEQLQAVLDTEHIFTEIAQSVQNVMDKVALVQNQVEESSHKKENVLNEMESITAVSEQTAGSAQEVFSTTEEMSAIMEEFNSNAETFESLARNLSNSIQKFKLK